MQSLCAQLARCPPGLRLAHYAPASYCCFCLLPLALLPPARCSDVERGFAAWRQNPHKLVGYYPRLALSPAGQAPRYVATTAGLQQAQVRG